MSLYNVLLVDDEEEFVDVFGMRLSARGFEVSTARRGEDALELAAKQTFDVVVLDLTMPGIGGVETLRRLRDIDPQMQVILLTGYSTEDKAKDAFELGALDFVSKPADFSELLAKMKEACARRRELLDSHEQE